MSTRSKQEAYRSLAIGVGAAIDVSGRTPLLALNSRRAERRQVPSAEALVSDAARLYGDAQRAARRYIGGGK